MAAIQYQMSKHNNDNLTLIIGLIISWIITNGEIYLLLYGFTIAQIGAQTLFLLNAFGINFDKVHKALILKIRFVLNNQNSAQL